MITISNVAAHMDACERENVCYYLFSVQCLTKIFVATVGIIRIHGAFPDGYDNCYLPYVGKNNRGHANHVCHSNHIYYVQSMPWITLCGIEYLCP